MKKILSLLIVILTVVSLTAFAVPSGAEGDLPHVVDFTNSLTSAEIKEYDAKLSEIGKKYSEDLVVVIVDEENAIALQEKYNESYYSLMAIADDYYDYNGYGAGEKKSGMLILLRTGEPYSNHFHLSTAGDLIGKCDSDEDIDEVYYEVKPHLVSGDISGAVGATVEGMEKLVSGAKGFHLAKKIIISLLIGFAVAGIAVLVMKSKLKSVGRQTAAASYVVPGSFNLVESRDLFLYANVSRTERASETRSGGGGHVSSSGVSHGGGTR